MKRLIFLVCLPLVASDRTEEKLADAVAKANRSVAHADARAKEAGQKLNSYCRERGQQGGIRPIDGLWGCVNPQPEPAKPKAEDPKPVVEPSKPKDK